MGTLNSQLRDEMLRASAGIPLQGYNITHIGLDTNYPTLSDMRKEISWTSPSNGEVQQDGTITIVIDVDHPEDVEIYGFNFYPDNDPSTSPNGDGNFQEIVNLAVGNEYTINIDGIKIILPQ